MLRRLTQILAVLAKKNGGELRIKRSALRKMNEESFRLFEDVDDKKDELVLRFDAKHQGVYVVEAECKEKTTTTVVQPQPRAASPSAITPTTPQSALPFTDEQLARAERRIAAMKTANAIKRERQPTS